MDFSNIRFNWTLAAALLAAIATLSGATARELQQQEIGTDICFCAPNVYEFTLDFALTCPPVNITLGDAVAATTCLVSPFGSEEVADLVPVTVSSIDVLELNQNLQVMVNENISPNEAFLDGDTFTYTSYAAIPGEIVTPEDLPRAIQLNIVGQNKNGEEIINMYLITFTSSCGAYPVLQEGQWAGWTRFSDLGPPSPELCPVVPTSAPTSAPTASPIMMSMSMSMSMDMGLEAFSIADLLESDVVYIPKAAKSKGKGKAGKREKSKSGTKDGKYGKDSNKLSKPYSKDGKAKDGKAKDGKSEKSKDGAKDGKAKDGKAKDGKPYSKDGKAKDGKAKDGKSEKSKDGAKAGKSEKSKDGAKSGKDSRKDTNKLAKPGDKVLKQGGKDGKSKDGKSKDGKSKDGKSKDGKSKDGAKAGKSKDGKAKDGKAKDGAKAGKSEKTKDGAKAGKSYKYEGNGQKPISEEQKEANKLNKSDKSKGKAGTKRLRI